jgi:putative transposase
LAATISRSADRWFVSFTCEVQRMIPVDNGNLGVVGVDVGVRHLAVLSTGMVVPNPRALERSLRKLRRLNRELTRRRPNSRRRKSTGRRLARVHLRAANLRRDAPHKLTTTLATEDGIVVVEQLNVAGLLRNRRLARAIADSGLGEVRGWVKAKLTLAERTFHCEACGLVLDRDKNAARNLAKLVRHVARSGRETETPV